MKKLFLAASISIFVSLAAYYGASFYYVSRISEDAAKNYPSLNQAFLKEETGFSFKSKESFYSLTSFGIKLIGLEQENPNNKITFNSPVYLSYNPWNLTFSLSYDGKGSRVESNGDSAIKNASSPIEFDASVHYSLSTGVSTIFSGKNLAAKELITHINSINFNTKKIILTQDEKIIAEAKPSYLKVKFNRFLDPISVEDEKLKFLDGLRIPAFQIKSYSDVSNYTKGPIPFSSTFFLSSFFESTKVEGEMNLEFAPKFNDINLFMDQFKNNPTFKFTIDNDIQSESAKLKDHFALDFLSPKKSLTAQTSMITSDFSKIFQQTDVNNLDTLSHQLLKLALGNNYVEQTKIFLELGAEYLEDYNNINNSENLIASLDFKDGLLNLNIDEFSASHDDVKLNLSGLIQEDKNKKYHGKLNASVINLSGLIDNYAKIIDRQQSTMKLLEKIENFDFKSKITAPEEGYKALKLLISKLPPADEKSKYSVSIDAIFSNTDDQMSLNIEDFKLSAGEASVNIKGIAESDQKTKHNLKLNTSLAKAKDISSYWTNYYYLNYLDQKSIDPTILSYWSELAYRLLKETSLNPKLESENLDYLIEFDGSSNNILISSHTFIDLLKILSDVQKAVLVDHLKKQPNPKQFIELVAPEFKNNLGELLKDSKK